MQKNETILQCFEWYLKDDGTFWKQVKAMAPSFRQMGITACWLPPAYKGAAGIHDVGYGVYDMYDLGEFNQKGAVRTKYGTKKEYQQAVQALHANNTAVIADIVFNHRMGGDQTETVDAVESSASDREEDVSQGEKIESWTKFTFPGRKGKYSSFTWDHTCFDGTDWDQEGHHSAVYRFADKQWDSDVDSDDGNYDYLMGCDLDMSNPRVVQELNDWGKWYLTQVPLDGVRLDAIKHIEFEFFEDWLKNMNAAAGKTLFAVGEYWNADVNRLMHYLDVNHSCLSLFDVTLHYRFYDACHNNGNSDMGAILNDTLVQRRPGNAVTFVDNHDTQPGQALASFVDAWFKPLAYAIILLRQDGIPCVFYGDLYGIEHDGIAPCADLKTLIKLRETNAYGQQTDYFDDSDCAGWTRSGDADHPDSGLAVIMSDRDASQKKMHVDQAFAGRSFADALQHCADPVVIDENGDGIFSCTGGSVSVYVPLSQNKK